MKIEHARLPKEVSKVYFSNLATLLVENECKRENINPDNVWAYFGKTDMRGVPRITIQVDHIQPSFKNSYVNGWSGFGTMRELVAYLEGYKSALSE